MIHSAMAIAPGEKAETRKLAQDVGARAAGQLEASLARVMAENGANNRWLLGALVVLNGGGIAVVAGLAGSLSSDSSENAIVFFVMGAALAVIAALGGALAALLLTSRIGEASALWAQVASSGELSEAAPKAAARVRGMALLSSVATLALALVSLIMFVGGGLTMGAGLRASSGQIAGEVAKPVVAEPSNAAAAPAPGPVPTPGTNPTPAATPAAKVQPAPEPKATPPKTAPKPAPQRSSASEAAPATAAATPPPAAPPSAGN